MILCNDLVSARNAFTIWKYRNWNKWKIKWAWKPTKVSFYCARTGETKHIIVWLEPYRYMKSVDLLRERYSGLIKPSFKQIIKKPL